MTKAADVTSQIWEMANRLRGNMDASEYRNYILGFMFYRYLSERQEKYLFENQILEGINSIEEVNEEYAKEANGDELPDYLDDIAGSLGYAIEPKYTAHLKRHVSATEGLCRPLLLDDVSLNAKGYERLTARMLGGEHGV